MLIRGSHVFVVHFNGLKTSKLSHDPSLVLCKDLIVSSLLQIFFLQIDSLPKI